MAYIMLTDLRVAHFFIYCVVKSFEKLFIYRLAIGCIMIYRTIKITNVLNKMANYTKLQVVES